MLSTAPLTLAIGSDSWRDGKSASIASQMELLGRQLLDEPTLPASVPPPSVQKNPTSTAPKESLDRGGGTNSIDKLCPAKPDKILRSTSGLIFAPARPLFSPRSTSLPQV